MTTDLPLCPICGNRIRIYHVEEPTLSSDTTLYANICGCTTCNIMIQSRSTMTADALKNEKHMEKVWQMVDLELVNKWNEKVRE